MENVGTYCWWTKSCTTKDDDYPIIYRVLTIPGGAGFRPSTVSSMDAMGTMMSLHWIPGESEAIPGLELALRHMVLGDAWWECESRGLCGTRCFTPRKINMEPEITPLEKDNDLPNHHFQVLC